MNKQRKTEIKVGITVVVGTLLLLWIISWAKNFSLSSTDYELNVRFQNVAGLEVGDYVTVNGVRSGFVERINVINDSVLVTLNIEENTVLFSDAVFQIAMLDLMGGKRVDVYPGTSGADIDRSIVHKGTFNADIPEVMRNVGAMGEDLPLILEKINSTLDGVNDYLQDEEMKDNLRKSLENLVQVSSQLNAMLYRNSEHFDSLALNGALLTSEVRAFIDTNNNKLAESFENVNTLVANANELISKVSSFMEETENQENNAGKLLYDEKFFTDMKETMNNLNGALKILVEQLENEGVNVDATIGF